LLTCKAQTDDDDCGSRKLVNQWRPFATTAPRCLAPQFSGAPFYLSDGRSSIVPSGRFAPPPQTAPPSGTFWELGSGHATQLLTQLVQATHASGRGRWEDDAFPPSPHSLCHDWGSHRRAFDWHRFYWNSISALVFAPGGANPCDIQQGMLGDCYFLAALSALADTHKDHVESLVVSNPAAMHAGISVCRLTWNGHWLCVPVSHTLPHCPGSSPHEGSKLAFSSAPQSGGMWVALVEKSLAKAHGSYQAIEGGSSSWALRDLTGAPTRMHSLEFGATGVNEFLSVFASAATSFFQSLMGRRRMNVEEHAGRQKELDSAASVWRAMVEASEQNFAMCASCGRSGDEEHLDESTGLIYGHGYTVLDVWDAKDNSECLVRLRNPWGKGRWKGKYCDLDPDKALPLFRSHSVQSDEDFEDGGVFWMSYADFCTHFSAIDICRVRRGYVSSSIDVTMPQLVHGHRTLSAVIVQALPNNSLPDGEFSLSLLQRVVSGVAQSDMTSNYHGVGMELYEVQGSLVGHVAVSQFACQREVSLHMRLRHGSTYFVIIHCQAKSQLRDGTMASVCTRSYAPCPICLEPFLGDVSGIRYGAYKAAVEGPGSKLVWSECGAWIRAWHDAESHITVMMFDSRGSAAGLLVSISWQLTGVLFQGKFPEEAEPADLVAARRGQEFQRGQVVQLQHGQQQMVVLTWFDAAIGCSLGYSYVAATMPCLLCGVPVGPAIPGKFSAGRVDIGPNETGGPGRVHAECIEAFRIRHASSCLQCGEPVARVEGKFEGSYFEYQEGDLGSHLAGKVHTECDIHWRRRWAEPCAHCGGPLMRVEGVYTGNFLVYKSDNIPGGSAKIHQECSIAYMGGKSGT